MKTQVIVSPSTAEAVGAEAERDRMTAALEHTIEYWNREPDEEAMYDALWHIIDTASNALRGGSRV